MDSGPPDSPTPPLPPRRMRSSPGSRAFSVLIGLVVGLLVVKGVGDHLRDRPEALPAHPTFYADGTYEFMGTQPYDDSVPITYDHCRPLVVTMNPAGAPPEAEEVLRDVMRIVGRVSGFTFRWGGLTTDRPLDLRRYGPIAVSWTTEAETADMTDDVAGRGGSTYAKIPGQRIWYQTGQIYLSERYFARLHRSGNTALMRAVLIHEMGHVLGLAHVDSREEIMAPRDGPNRLGHGDLTGLAKLGTQPCA